MFGRLMTMVGLGKIAGTRDDAPVRVAQVWLSEVETRDQTAMLQQYGFSSRPHPGADTAQICLGGDKSKMIIIATHDQRYFFALTEGEMAIHDDLGQSVHLTRTGIVINGGGKAITIVNTPSVTQDGDLRVKGEVIRGYGGADQVTLGQHHHGTGTAAAGTVAPTAGT